MFLKNNWFYIVLFVSGLLLGLYFGSNGEKELKKTITTLNTQISSYQNTITNQATEIKNLKQSQKIVIVKQELPDGTVNTTTTIDTDTTVNTSTAANTSSVATGNSSSTQDSQSVEQIKYSTRYDISASYLLNLHDVTKYIVTGSVTTRLIGPINFGPSGAYNSDNKRVYAGVAVRYRF